MSLPYETRKTDIVVTAAPTIFNVPFPDRTNLTKIIIRQTDGADQTFTADVFSKDPALFTAADPESLYRVGPTLSVTAGVSENFFSVPLPFVNWDEMDFKGSRPRKLWLRFNTVTVGTYTVLVGAIGNIV